MKEYKIILHTLKYLISEEKFIPEYVSIPILKERKFVKNKLSKIDEELIENITKFSGSKQIADIKGYYKHNRSTRQRIMTIEAKGGDIFYNFYTMLGQFLTLTITPSDYHWFAFAVPLSWKEKIKNSLRHNDEIKPIINDIINKYTSQKSKQGLWFYFVDDNSGMVIKETWRKILR